MRIVADAAASVYIDKFKTARVYIHIGMIYREESLLGSGILYQPATASFHPFSFACATRLLDSQVRGGLVDEREERRDAAERKGRRRGRLLEGVSGSIPSCSLGVPIRLRRISRGSQIAKLFTLTQKKKKKN